MPATPHTGRLFYRVGYTAGFFSFLQATARLAGRNASGKIACSLARIYCSTAPAIVEVVARNLPLLTNRAVSHTEASTVFSNFATTLSDYIWLASRSREDGFKLADVDGNFEHLRTACAGGQGAILATGHYGFFEFGALVLGQMGFPVSIITHPEPSPALTRWRAGYRSRWGAETIELGNDAFSSLRAVEAIKRGRLTAVLIDRPQGGPVLPIALPGGAIPYSLAPALLSWMTGCSIVPVTVRRTTGGRYAISSSHPVAADRSLPRKEALELCTREVAASLHEDFLKDPLQWYHFVPLDSADGMAADSSGR